MNRLTTILLDIFEDQADVGRLIVMDDARTLLDRQLEMLGRVVLSHGGSVTAIEARQHAEGQYDIFDADRRLKRHAEADRLIADLNRQAKALPKTPRK